ncbi:hypothetical protein [uncultured Hyphomicrobium sp.]|uniref:hypothetical protein n=1 Tax=uncultured Hyphomicrobium sp. TaxID=194373 RepID=UPI0025DE6CC8|nr:hypothetical protein [uncultured Hyphomicrobium sp.]
MKPRDELTLSTADSKRLKRISARRGRRNPSKVPARLTRTAAFAPKRQGLITDSRFKRLYVVPGHSVIQVSGRELGSQHRDALYAVFRLDRKETHIIDPDNTWRRRAFASKTTWRELLRLMGVSAHVNNVATLVLAFQEIKQVVITAYEGDAEILLERFKEGSLPKGGGTMGNILYDVTWTGMRLDDVVTITYGDWTVEAMMKARLVSLNADIQFSLKSDYAKSFWPYIDGMNAHSFVDEEMLGHLTGKEVVAMTSMERSNFRKACRSAFEDMVRVGGIVSWQEEVRGLGRHKTRRYHYHHGLQPQLELELRPKRTT